MVDSLWNLTPEAATDLESVLGHSLQWGSAKALETQQRIITMCRRIADGEGLGHKRSDIPTTKPTLFIAAPPLVIAYNPETKLVLRIVDGRRDLGRLFR